MALWWKGERINGQGMSSIGTMDTFVGLYFVQKRDSLGVDGIHYRPGWLWALFGPDDTVTVSFNCCMLLLCTAAYSISTPM